MSVKKKRLTAGLLAAVVCIAQVLGSSVTVSAKSELNQEWEGGIGLQEEIGTAEITQYDESKEVQELAAGEQPDIQTAEALDTEREFDCVYDFVENSAEEGTLTVTYKSGRPGKVIKFLENSSNVRFFFAHNPLLRSVSFFWEREYSGNFAGCSNLTSVHLPDGLRVISRSAFEDCSSLEEIVIPESVEKIEECVFSGCTSLRTVSLPKSVKMSWGTFSGCTSLKEITIPEGVEKIGDYMFENCTSLEKITIPEGVTSIGSYTF